MSSTYILNRCLKKKWEPELEDWSSGAPIGWAESKQVGPINRWFITRSPIFECISSTCPSTSPNCNVTVATTWKLRTSLHPTIKYQKTNDCISQVFNFIYFFRVVYSHFYHYFLILDVGSRSRHPIPGLTVTTEPQRKWFLIQNIHNQHRGNEMKGQLYWLRRVLMLEPSLYTTKLHVRNRKLNYVRCPAVESSSI